MINTKHILYVGVFIGLTILGIIFLPKDEIVVIDDLQESTEEQIEDTIFVHIEGAINSPGVKEVKRGTRLFELIELSDGELEEADLSRLNLSQVLKDEQKVVVPYKVNEQEEKTSQVNTTKAIAKSSSNNSSLVNINYASKEELETLPGIGPAMASKIIDYRNENGFFNSIEDIKNISGIGDAKFEKIKDKITEVGGV
jgi:competence protein ComEA